MATAAPPTPQALAQRFQREHQELRAKLQDVAARLVPVVWQTAAARPALEWERGRPETSMSGPSGWLGNSSAAKTRCLSLTIPLNTQADPLLAPLVAEVGADPAILYGDLGEILHVLLEAFFKGSPFEYAVHVKGPKLPEPRSPKDAAPAPGAPMPKLNVTVYLDV
jgi:hypothetical protein